MKRLFRGVVLVALALGLAAPVASAYTAHIPLAVIDMFIKVGDIEGGGEP